jgi:HEAT repeat-containing protein 5
MRELTPPDPLDLNNLVSLPQEKQSALVLQWLTDCESFLTCLTPEELSQHQQTFQQAFLNLLSLPTPPIGHVLRNCLGRCFSDIFTRGDRRVLFDTVSTLLQKTSQLRVDKEAKQKQYYPCS